MAGIRGTRKAFWLAHLERARAQDGTLKDYAQANGLSLKQLYAASSRQRASEVPGADSSRPAVAGGGPTLLPVQLKRDSAVGSIRVSLTNGVLFELPSDVQVAHWRELLERVVQR